MISRLFRPRAASVEPVWRALSSSKPDLKVTGKKSSNIKYFKIYRWDPEQKQKPYVSTYPINLDECGPMVLGMSHRSLWSLSFWRFLVEEELLAL